MRAFWIILALAFVLGGLWLVLRPAPSTNADPLLALAPTPTTTPDSPTTTAPDIAPAAIPDAPIPDAPTAEAPAPPTTPSQLPVDPVDPITTDASTAVAQTPPTPDDTTNAPDAPTASADAPEERTAATETIATLPKVGGFEVAPGEVVPVDGGGLKLDGRFNVPGSGTRDDPYRLTWDLLISAEEGFDPQRGLKRVPARIAALDGKWVTIQGYVAYPMMVQQPRELLMMLNQWDGCCIGVPPTPYDAIEVQLDNPADADQRLLTSGGVKGRLLVRPYVVGDWLVGMFVMERGEILMGTGNAAGS